MKDINDLTITAEVVKRLANTPDPRLREILETLVTHLHQFARDARLTEREWLAGIEYLTKTGQQCDAGRQEFILLSDTLGLSQLVVSQNHRRGGHRSEQTVLGPFFVDGLQPRFSQGDDIRGPAVGDPLYISATVRSDGEPVVGARVEIWQADAEGRYDVQSEGWSPEKSYLRAAFMTDAQGRFSCWTVLPKSYPIPMDGPVGDMMRATRRSPMRPAHVHFAIEKLGFDRLVTHVYAEGDEFLESDAVFGVRSSCIGRYEKHGPGTAADGRLMGAPFYTLLQTFEIERMPS
jgi:hydroxyquinol 1,2-dioxygenase